MAADRGIRPAPPARAVARGDSCCGRAGAAGGGRVPLDRGPGYDALPAATFPGDLSLAGRGRRQRALAALAGRLHSSHRRRVDRHAATKKAWIKPSPLNFA